MRSIAAEVLIVSLALVGCRAGSVAPVPEEAVGPEPPVEPDAWVRGTVRAPDGTPVQGARVAAVAADHAYWLDVLSREPVPAEDEDGLVTTHTDSNGRFRIESLPCEGRYFLLASAEGWATSGAADLGMVSGLHHAPLTNLALRKLSRLELLVVDSKGTPVPHAQVGEVTYSGRFFGERTVPPGSSPGRRTRWTWTMPR